MTLSEIQIVILTVNLFFIIFFTVLFLANRRDIVRAYREWCKERKVKKVFKKIKGGDVVELTNKWDRKSYYWVLDKLASKYGKYLLSYCKRWDDLSQIDLSSDINPYVCNEIIEYFSDSTLKIIDKNKIGKPGIIYDWRKRIKEREDKE